MSVGKHAHMILCFLNYFHLLTSGIQSDLSDRRYYRMRSTNVNRFFQALYILKK